jgi:hypothetical protein
MKRIAILSAILSAAILMAACDRSVEPDEAFLAGQDIQLKVNGQVIYTYDPLTWQLSYNAGLKEFRAFDDPVKNWFSVVFDNVPAAVGDKVTATISWGSAGEPTSLRNTLKVVKSEGDTFWLWRGDKKSQTGVTVCILR